MQHTSNGMSMKEALDKKAGLLLVGAA